MFLHQQLRKAARDQKGRGAQQAASRKRREKLKKSSTSRVLEVDTQFAQEFQGKLATRDKEQGKSLLRSGRDLLSFQDEGLDTEVPFGFVHPMHWGKLVWDACICLLIAYSAVMVPLRIAFNLLAETGSPVQIFDYIVDGLFGVDIIVSFFTVYMDDVGAPVCNHYKIVWHYLRTWFVIDLLSTIPIDLVVTLVSGTADDEQQTVSTLKLLRVLRLARLLKMVRLLKINKLLEGADELRDMFDINPALTRLMKFFFLAAFMGHLLACFWFWVATIQESTDPTWIEVEGLTDANWWSQYWTSLYWTFATMTTVGYGDVRANTDVERVYSIFTQLVGASAFGFIIGNISTILETIDARAAAFKRKMDELTEYLRHRQFPAPLAKRIHRYYQYYLSRKSSFDEATILSEVSHHLRNQIVLQSNHDAISKIKFFADQDEGLVAILITQMKPMFQIAGETICSQGHVGKEMYFLLKGAVQASVSDLRSEDTIVGIVMQGNYCGDIALVLNRRRPMTLKAIVNCDMFALSKEDLVDALYHYVEVNNYMTEAAVRKSHLLRDARFSLAHAVLRCEETRAPRGSRMRVLQDEPIVFTNERLCKLRTIPAHYMTPDMYESMKPLLPAHEAQALTRQASGHIVDTARVGALRLVSVIKAVVYRNRVTSMDIDDGGNTPIHQLSRAVHARQDAMEAKRKYNLAAAAAAAHNYGEPGSYDPVDDASWRAGGGRGAHPDEDPVAAATTAALAAAGEPPLGADRADSSDDEAGAAAVAPAGSGAGAGIGAGAGAGAGVGAGPDARDVAVAESVGSLGDAKAAPMEPTAGTGGADSDGTAAASKRSPASAVSVSTGSDKDATGSGGGVPVAGDSAADGDPILGRLRGESVHSHTVSFDAEPSGGPVSPSEAAGREPNPVASLPGATGVSSGDLEVDTRYPARLPSSLRDLTSIADDYSTGTPVSFDPHRLHYSAANFDDDPSKGGAKPKETTGGPGPVRDKRGSPPRYAQPSSRPGGTPNMHFFQSERLPDEVPAFLKPPSPMSPTIVNPTSNPKLAWDLLVGGFIMYSVVTVPFFIGFDQDAEDGWLVLNIIVDVVFVIDMLVSFRTAYIHKFDDQMETDTCKIATRYLQTWFIVDFASAVPWDWIVGALLGTDSSTLRSLKLVRVLRLARLAKLFRLFRLKRVLVMLEKTLNLPPAAFRLCKLFFQVSFIAHLMSCFWYYVSTLGDEAWWQKPELHLTDASSAQLYTAALYFSYTTMTTVGYGDVAAMSDEEKMYAVVAMIVGGTVFGYIVGSMASLFGRFNGGEARNREKMEQVAEYMRERNLSKKLRRKVRQYYVFYLDRKTAFDEAKILGDLTENLKAEAILHLNRDIIGKIPFFRLSADIGGGRDDGFTAYIMSIMNPMFVVPEDYIFKQNEIGLEMYFLVKGEVAVLADADTNEEKLLATLPEGSFFGEIAVLIGTKRTASIKALTYCNLFTLKKDDLNLMILHYPHLGKMMQDTIMTKLEAMIQGEVTVPVEQAVAVAKSMRREVHRLGAMVKKVSRMSLLEKASAADLRAHLKTSEAVVDGSGRSVGTPVIQSSRRQLESILEPGSDGEDDYDSEEEEAAVRESMALGSLTPYLRKSREALSGSARTLESKESPAPTGMSLRGSPSHRSRHAGRGAGGLAPLRETDEEASARFAGAAPAPAGGLHGGIAPLHYTKFAELNGSVDDTVVGTMSRGAEATLTARQRRERLRRNSLEGHHTTLGVDTVDSLLHRSSSPHAGRSLFETNTAALAAHSASRRALHLGLGSSPLSAGARRGASRPDPAAAARARARRMQSSRKMGALRFR